MFSINTVKTAFVAMMASLCLTSCMEDKEPIQTYKYTYADNYSYVYDADTDVATLVAGAKYEFNYDAIGRTVDITIRDLQLGLTTSKLTFSVEKVPYKIDSNSAIAISGFSFKGRSNGDTYDIADFNFRQYEREIGGTSFAIYYDVSFVVDGRYKVRAVQANGLFEGTNYITDLNTGQTKEEKRGFYYYSLGLDKRVATVEIHKLYFGTAYVDCVKMEGLPFSVSDDGIKIAVEGSVPGKATGTTAKEINIRNLDIEIDYVPDMTATFNINGMYDVLSVLPSRMKSPSAIN